MGLPLGLWHLPIVTHSNGLMAAPYFPKRPLSPKGDVTRDDSR